MKAHIKVYQMNPNGTNDIEIIDTSTGESIDSMQEALFGVNVIDEGNSRYSYNQVIKFIAVSPITDGSEAIKFLNKYFK